MAHMSDNQRIQASGVMEALTRRGGLRVDAEGLCTEITESAEQLGLLVDVSESGLRLERPYQPMMRTRERVVQIELEHPGVDELLWVKGVIRYDKLEQSAGRVVRTSGIEIVAAAGRHLRLLRDYVGELRTRLVPEDSPWAQELSTAFRLG
jgi:PilZ domain